MSVIRKILVVLFAVSQSVTAYLTTLGSTSQLTNETSTPLITPAGYAFSIWAVITAGSIAYGVYQLIAHRNSEIYARIAPYSILLFAGFDAWLYAAQQNWIWLTLVIFIGMGFCLLRILPLLVVSNRAGHLSRIEQVVTYGTFGLYAGWTTAALFANTAAAIKFSGVPDTSTLGMVIQTGLLLVATIVSAFSISRLKGSTPYTLAILWAFGAIAIGTYMRNAFGFTVLALVATVLLLLQYLRSRFLATAVSKN
jgi:hypothetical protein